MLTTFSCVVDTTDNSAPLGVEIWFDNDLIYNNNHVTEAETVTYDFKDVTGSHELRFIMKNKTDLHTRVDAQGNIISDACITISHVAFDGMELKHGLVEHSTYTHAFNGQQTPEAHKFYGTMGCNGTVSLPFTTPVYPWLLEHM